MSYTAAEFLNNILPTINGWLYPGAVEVTEMLLHAQKSLEVSGGGVEIGVYQGAYLSYLVGATEGCWAGFDVFLFDQRPITEANLSRVIEITKTPSTVELFHCNTQAVTQAGFEELLEKANIESIAFASIDGDHSAAGVASDLRLIESKLSPGGIVSLDDMFSPSSPAVAEGFFRYMSDNSHLKPIIFSDNKLFLTTKGYDELYQIRCMIALAESLGTTGKRWKDGTAINRVRPFLGERLITV